MKYTYLGNTGLMISKIGLGTMRVENLNKDTLFKIFDKAYNAGINFYDTADVYGRGYTKNPKDPFEGTGKHTEVLGDWLEKADCRDEIVLSSKLRWQLKLYPNNEGFSRNHIIKSINNSLSQLNTDYLDLLFLHGDSPTVPLFDVMKTLDDLQSAFKFNYLGTSNMMAYRIMEAVMISRYNGLVGITALQTKYSLIDRDVYEREHEPLAQDLNLGVIGYGALSEGFLSGIYQKDSSLPDKSNAEDVYNSGDNPRNWAIVNTLNDISEEQGVKQGQIAIAWVLNKETIDSPLLGVSSIDQLEFALGALDIDLTRDQIDQLDQVSKVTHPWWRGVYLGDFLSSYHKLIEKYGNPYFQSNSNSN